MLTTYDPSWPRAFEAEGAALRRALGNVAVEHVGSTAVPGLDARPIVDILVGVGMSSPTPLDGLLGLGYVAQDSAKEGRFFAKPGFWVHVVLAGGGEWLNHLALRDFLRSQASEAERYAAQKRAGVERTALLAEWTARARAWKSNAAGR